MRYVKSNRAKLIVSFFTINCIFLLVLAAKCEAGNKYVVQVAATKTPVDIQHFFSTHNISDTIYEFKSDYWYRYVIGDFTSYKAASDYVLMLVQQTTLKNAFVRVMADSLGIVKQFPPSKLVINSGLPENNIENPPSTTSKDQIREDVSSGHSGLNQNETNNEDSGSLLGKVNVRKERKGNLRNKLLDFGARNLPGNLQKFYFRNIDILLDNPVIFIFVFFIHFFVLNIIGVYVILYFTVRKKNYRERYVKFYGQMYEDILMSYMFGIYNWDTVMIKFKRIKRKLNRRILISILLNFHENLKGDVNILIPEIYVNLGLHNDSLKSARSIFNYKKIQGIRELTYLYPEGALKIIPDLINNTDDSVRSEAQTAFIRLNPDNPFSFFDILVKPFTRWTQISAFNLIRLYQLPVPEFAKYLGSKHFNVRNFSLRMITYFQQLENVSQIFKMLDSNSERTRLLSYKAINDLRLYDGKELIKNRFGNETDKNKLEIVKAINNIGLTEDFSFLEKIISSGSVSLKIEACRTMYYMSSEGREKLLLLKENTNPELELYIAHVRDARN